MRINVSTQLKIIARIEDILRHRLGEDIYIPLLLVDEKSLALASVIEKASEVTQLMAKIATDLMAVTKDLAGQYDKLKDNIEEFSRDAPY